MKRRSSNQIKKILIGTVVLVAVVLVGLIIFLITVDIKGVDDVQDNTENLTNNESTTQNIVSIDDNDLSEYDIIAKDEENTFEVRLNGGKIYFSVLDDNDFSKKYPKAEINTSKDIEIATHDYKVSSVLVGFCKNEEYLIVLMKDGTLGIMNVSDAVENNVFRIKNQLISIGSVKAINVSKGYKKSNNKQEDTIIVEVDDGKKYDLADFVE